MKVPNDRQDTHVPGRDNSQVIQIPTHDPT